MEKERTRSMQASLSMWLLVVGLVSQNLLNAVLSSPHSFEEQKHYYTPAPHAGTPPTGSHHRTPAPTGKCEPTPPKRHKTPPKHHGGNPTPYTPPGGGGSPHTPTPYTPPGGGGSPHTPTPSTPRGGGYYPSPPTSGGSPSPPVVSPPTTPTPVPNPGTPYVPAPETPTTPSTPPFLPDPNTPGTCDYWKHHPTLVWGVVGWFGLGSLGGAFGHSSLPGISPGLTCLDALSNTLTNGYGALYREGTASLLNSVVNHKFPYSTQEVRDHFASGLASNNAAETQAQLFKMANEGKVKSKA
uniref:Protodermal factor 1 n=1 Tax=Kalanchoe fedtschenkoi TaxID=63787 RepID=A0A7N0TJA7_KALFE